MKYYDKLIFDLSKEGRQGYSLPVNKWTASVSELPEGLRRGEAPALPQVSELDVVRHYTNLSQMNFGVDSGFYPLGSCTMKYNPKINEEIAAMPAFAGLHPLQPATTVQGVLRLYKDLAHSLSAITGMAEFTLNGSHKPIGKANHHRTSEAEHKTHQHAGTGHDPAIKMENADAKYRQNAIGADDTEHLRCTDKGPDTAVQTEESKHNDRNGTPG